MGRWTPLMLMTGGLAILMGTLLGINFPMDGQETAGNNAPTEKSSKVLPANINVNSSAPSGSTSSPTTAKNNSKVVQDDFSVSDEIDTVAQGSDSLTSTPTSISSPESTSRRTNSGVGSVVSSSAGNRAKEPIRALW